MVLLANTAEGGTDTASVTTGNSGGASGDAWSSVTGTTPPIYSDDTPLKGAMSIRCHTPGSQQSVVWTFASTTQVVARFYFQYLTELTQQSRILTFTGGGRLYVSNGEAPIIVSSTGSLLWTASQSFTVGTTYRVEISNHANGASGALVLETFLGDDTTPIPGLSNTITGQNFGTAVTGVSFGRLINTGGGDLLLDDLAVETDTLTLLGPSGAGAIDLTVADLTVASTIDTIAVTQTHVLAVEDLTVPASIDTVTLTQVHVLEVADLTVAATVDAVALTQVHELEVADLTIQPTIDTVTLTVDGIDLEVADLTVDTSLDAVTLSQTHQLAVADLTVTPAIDTLTLTQVHVLAVSDLAVNVTVDTVTLIVGVITYSAERTLTVLAEPRRYPVRAEARQFNVPSESRILEVP